MQALYDPINTVHRAKQSLDISLTIEDIASYHSFMRQRLWRKRQYAYSNFDLESPLDRKKKPMYTRRT